MILDSYAIYLINPYKIVNLYISNIMEFWIYIIITIFVILPLSKNHNLRKDKYDHTNKPTIGILTKPCKEELPTVECGGMLEARYIRWVEQAGGRAIPIHYDATEEQIDYIMDRINGVFFTGGGNDLFDNNGHLLPYSITGLYIMNHVLLQNSKGKFMPLWGTCLGFELISVLISNSTKILSYCPDRQCIDYATTIQFAQLNTKLFSLFSEEEIRDLENIDLNYNWHSFMVTPETWESSQLLTGFFDIVAYSYSKNGTYKYVSAFQGKFYPFYGLQWHPEYNNFDFNPGKNIVRTELSGRVSQIFANIFLDRSRQSNNQFEEGEEVNYDMSNYQMIFHHTRQLCYIFP